MNFDNVFNIIFDIYVQKRSSQFFFLIGKFFILQWMLKSCYFSIVPNWAEKFTNFQKKKICYFVFAKISRTITTSLKCIRLNAFLVTLEFPYSTKSQHLKANYRCFLGFLHTMIIQLKIRQHRICLTQTNGP